MKTLAEAVTALEQELDVLAVLRRYENSWPVGAGYKGPRGLTCPVAQYLREQTGREVYVGGKAAWYAGETEAVILPVNIYSKIALLDREINYN